MGRAFVLLFSLTIPLGVEYIHDEITAPTKIDEANLKGKKIVDFDMGQDISVILTGILSELESFV